MSYIKLKNGNVYYEIFGEGEPLIFLHNGFYSSYTWSGVVKRLSRYNKAIVYDRFGYGRSDKYGSIDGDIVDKGVEELAEFIDALNLPKVNLLGHCLGGAIALLYSLKEPDRVCKIIAESVGYYSDHKLEIKTDWTFRPYDEIPHDLRDYLVAMHGEDYSKTFWDLIRTYRDGYIMNPDYNILNSIKNIKIPVLIMNGDRDFYFDIEHPLCARKKLKNSQFCVIPGAGHDVHADKPEEFCLAVETFLNNCEKCV
ncbi:MAG TPA: alpha/beta hydrolase [Spirochaetota bacterium]|jgi:pimeloyl-ACP methyl ester carboxylesterase|nr:MAG: Proline iminopeptidase [Spirochaetes bacterium ADurb.Bin133]HNZ26088.1 alpha/beta hydrolase [Spirochaetota bacterium]HPY86749.1 alpha/beta hydrolase [Spirochaetota bacterium]HQB61222.1 alpha/beta hydrolase [Spirochaetota bacterium]